MTNTPSLTLKDYFPPSMLNRCLVERYPMERIEALFRSDFLGTTFKKSNYAHDKAIAAKHKNEKAQLLAIKTDTYTKGVFEVRYQPGQNSMYGRVFPERALGLTGLAKRTRNTLIKDLYYDFDLSNAHPAILTQLCKIHGIQCAAIQDYVEKRSTYKRLVSSYYGIGDDKLTKTLFIRIMFGGTTSNWLSDIVRDNNMTLRKTDVPRELVAMETELKAVSVELQKYNEDLAQHCRTTIDLREENKRKFALARGKEPKPAFRNYDGSFLSSLLQYLETVIISAALDGLLAKTSVCRIKESDLPCVTYEYDGLKLLKETVDAEFNSPSEMCRFLENEVFERTGYRMAFEVKPIEEVHDIAPFLHLDKSSEDELEVERSDDDDDEEEEAEFVYEYDFSCDFFVLAKFLQIALPPTQHDAIVSPFKTKMVGKKEKEVLKLQEQMEKALADALYELRKPFFEHYHAKITTLARIARRTKEGVVGYYTRNFIRDMYDNEISKVFVKRWLLDDHALQFEGCVFHPPGKRFPPKDEDTYFFNLFSGFRIDKILTPEIKAMTDEELLPHFHVILVQCWLLVGKGRINLEFFLNFLAHIVQYPGDLPRVCILIQSHEGVGKNLLMENFGRMILGARYCLSTQDVEKVCGKFPAIEQKLLLMLDEVHYKNASQYVDAIKHLVTTERTPIERKNVDAFEIDNCIRLFFFSNYESPLVISRDDRRHVVFKASDEKRNNEKWVKTLISCFQDDFRMACFGEFLLRRDLSNFNPTNDRPKTKAYREIQHHAVSTVTRFFASLAVDCDEIGYGTNTDNADLLFSIDATGKPYTRDRPLSVNYQTVTFRDGKVLYERYKSFCSHDNLHFKQGTPFFKEIAGQDYKTFLTVKKTKKCNHYILHIPNLVSWQDLAENQLDFIEPDDREDPFPAKYTPQEKSVIWLSDIQDELTTDDEEDAVTPASKKTRLV
jgi:hypothetical protein